MQLKVLLSLCTFREIAYLHRHFFIGNNLAIEAAGEFVVRRRMENLSILRRLMGDYQEMLGE